MSGLGCLISSLTQNQSRQAHRGAADLRGVKLRYCEKILLEQKQTSFAFLSSLIYNHSATVLPMQMT